MKSILARSYSLYNWTDGTARSYPQTVATAFPRTAALAISGSGSSHDQTYPPRPYANQIQQIGSNGFFSYATYNGNPCDWIGRHDVVLLGGAWEGSFTSSSLDRALLVDAIKSVQNVAGYLPTSCWQYHDFDSFHSTQYPGTGPYASLALELSKKNWYLYNAANQGGSKIATAYGYETNWACAWPGASAGVVADQMFSPGRDVAGIDGSPEDYTQYAAAYFAELTFVRHSLITTQVDAAIPASSYTDSRFSPTLPYNSMSNPDYMKAPNLDAIYTDNCFALPRYAGYYNLQSSQPGGNASAATAASAAAPWLVRGAQHLFDRFQKIMSRAYSGRNYLNVANLSGWQWSDYYGDFATATNGLINTMNGGLMEGALGTSYGVSTWAGVRHAYNAVMDFCMSPKQVVLGCWVQGLASSLGTADYQQARYCISTTLMDDGYCCISTDGANSNGASYAVDDYVWWDEYGGNPNTNISKGWLGFPRGSRPSAAAVSGVWMRDFDNGVVLCNPKGNGARTITLAQINTHFGSSYVLKFFKGQQLPSVNSNSTMSSVTLQDSDGILLLKA